MNDLKIYEIICPVEFGGGENQALLRAIELKKRGIDITVICLAKAETFETMLSRNSIKFIRLTNRSLGFSPSLLKYILYALLIIPSFIANKRYFKDVDVINAHGFPPILMPVMLRPFFGKSFDSKVIFYTHHSYPRSKLFVRLKRIFECILKRYDKIIAVSSKVKEKALEEIFPTLRHKMVIIPNGIDIKEFSIKNDKFWIRKALNLPLDELIAIYPARFAPYKNHRFLLRVLPKVAGFRLLLAGDGSERAPFINKAKNRCLFDRILLIGNVPHEVLIQYLYASDFCIFPSKQEGFSLAIAEAMMAGLPTIIFKDIYLPEYGNNLLVANDETSFVELTKRLIENKHWREELSRKVKMDALNCSIGAATDKYLNLCRSVVAEKHSVGDATCHVKR